MHEHAFIKVQSSVKSLNFKQESKPCSKRKVVAKIIKKLIENLISHADRSYLHWLTHRFGAWQRLQPSKGDNDKRQ